MSDVIGAILVVDDEPALIETVTRALTEEGYFAVGATDGAAALDILSYVQVDLILLDMRMPGVDGWQVASELQSRSLGTPIIVMTGNARAQQIADEIGAAGYLEKPFSFDLLFTEVAAHLPH
jgi:two-component system response regulator MprA